MIKGKQRFHSLNFILWFSFLIFAAFIIALTWIFQTTLLRVFFTSQAEEDLGAIGRSAYERLNGALRGREDGVVGNYVDEYVNYCIADLQRDNPLVSIYVMDQAGEVLFPSDEGDFAVSDDTAQEEDYPDLERFNMMQDKLARQEDEFGYVFVHQLFHGTFGDDVWDDAHPVDIHFDHRHLFGARDFRADIDEADQADHADHPRSEENGGRGLYGQLQGRIFLRGDGRLGRNARLCERGDRKIRSAAKGSSRQCYARFKDAAYHDQGICVDDPGNFGR